MNRLSKFAAAVILIAPLAVAQQSRIFREGDHWTQEITGTLAAARNVQVKVDGGSVRVEGGSQGGITYTIRSHGHAGSEESARREFDAYKINASVRADTAWIVAEWEGRGHGHVSSDFTIQVPRNTDSVKLETDGGSLATRGITGRVDAQSGGGNIQADDIGGQMYGETGGGSIDVGRVGGDVDLHTGGGSIKVGAAQGKITAETGGGSVVVVSGLKGAILETGGGNIHVDRCAGSVKATTGGGSIDFGDISGPVEAETGGGSIHVVSAKGPVRAETGGGSIELNGISSAHAETGAGGIVARFTSANTDRSESVLQTSAGDITVYLAPDLHLNVRASIELANGHGIHTDFPEIHVSSEGDWGPKTVTAEGGLNGGGPLLKVITTTGDINLRRASR